VSRSQVLGHEQHNSSLRSLLVVYHFSLSGRNLVLEIVCNTLMCVQNDKEVPRQAEGNFFSHRL